MISLNNLLSGDFPTDLGPVDKNQEAAYRRGYHQAIAEVAHVLHCTTLSAKDLDTWVEGVGIRWRKDMQLDRKITPPELI